MDHHEEKPLRYLRLEDLRIRYGYKSKRSVERAAKDGRLPPPDLYLSGRFPLWAEQTLDAHDRAAARALSLSRKPAPTTTPDALTRAQESGARGRRRARPRKVKSAPVVATGA